MSNKANDEWIEAARENFEEAVSTGNITLAKDIIHAENIIKSYIR